MKVLEKHNVQIRGSGPTSLLLAHGYGCNQDMWQYLIPALQDTYRIVTFDYVGHGKAVDAFYDKKKYATLEGFADDIIEICQALNLEKLIFVGHSVSAMIGILALKKIPDIFSKLVLVCPSPRYINDDSYEGGFTQSNIEELIEFLDNNHLGWANSMAPVIMDNADRPELSERLNKSFCLTNPEVAKHFAKVTFFSDNRKDLSCVNVPTLILECAKDAIAPRAVGVFVHKHIPGSELVTLNAKGHCPHLSAPEQVIKALEMFLEPAKLSVNG